MITKIDIQKAERMFEAMEEARLKSLEPAKRKPDDVKRDRAYAQWQSQVDVIINERFGNDASSLPDRPYYEMWEDGVTPEEAAQEAYEYMHGKETDYS